LIRTYDVGSLPFAGDFIKFSSGAKVTPFTELLYPTKYVEDKKYFKNIVKAGFLNKIKAGIDIPNYPQYRDMSLMFLKSIKGVEKRGEGYELRGRPSISQEQLLIPEVQVLKERCKEISEEVSKKLAIKICVTGPYTLSSYFHYRGIDLFTMLGDALSHIVKSNIFQNKYGAVMLVAIDEPIFGFIDDPLLDYGYDGREKLLHAWEHIFHMVKSKNVKSSIHLHNTSNELFWQVKTLDIVESHVYDPLYSSPRTSTLLEKEDKMLRASIAITNFDTLIRHKIQRSERTNEAVLNQQIANVWETIRKGKRNPIDFVESVKTMTKRMNKILNQFTENRITYAGPECGLRSFPTLTSAIECLRRVSMAIKDVTQ
jgi:5-methyltetrahydropteroyltriglutamate--homocysteine methyltransferase